MILPWVSELGPLLGGMEAVAAIAADPWHLSGAPDSRADLQKENPGRQVIHGYNLYVISSAGIRHPVSCRQEGKSRVRFESVADA